MDQPNQSFLQALNGKHLKISGNFFPPYIYTTVENGITRFAGANYEIVRSASEKLNFTFDLDAIRGKPTGQRLPNGTWNGLFGDIFYKKSDVAIVLAHTADRNGLVDFTPSFGSANLVFTTAFPTTEINPEAIAYAFSPGVWLLYFLTMVACIPLVYYGSHLSFKLSRNRKISLIEAMLMVIKVCLEESTAIPDGAYVPAGLLLLFTIIMGTGYKCNLLSLLSFPSKGKIPTTFEDLNARADYKIYFDMSGIVGYNFFKNGKSPLLISLRDRFEPNRVFGNPANCLVWSLMEPKAACIGWHTVLSQFKAKNLTIARNAQSVFQNTKPIMSTWVTVGLQKDSPYTEAFSFITSSYFETGHVTKWLQDIVDEFQAQGIAWMKTQRKSKTYKAIWRVLEESSGGVAKPLSVNNFKVVFALLIFGFLVSLLRFALEVGFQKVRVKVEKRASEDKVPLLRIKRKVDSTSRQISVVSLISQNSKEEIPTKSFSVSINELLMPKEAYLSTFYKSPFEMG